MTATAQTMIGQVIGHYRVEALIGNGGMGLVYRAVHVDDPQQVAAIKVLHAAFAQNAGFQARLLQEASAIESLQHPHIVQVYEAGEQEGFCYLTMELLADGSLNTLLQRRPEEHWPLAMGIELVRQAASALDYAHAQGMVHRDVKPDNLLLIRNNTLNNLESYTLKVSDFGLVWLAEGGVSTPTGFTLGTPAYLSPEQCQGLELDGRSDIYALGVILYQVATGLLPFEARTINDAVFKHVYTKPEPPRQKRPELPEELEQLILKCLAKSPDDRYATAGELVSDLEEVLKLPALALPSAPGAPEPLPALRVETSTPWLAIRNQQGRLLGRVELTGEGLTIGRAPDNGFVLKSWWVAAHHAQIDWDGTQVLITDLGSQRGTLLEGSRLAKDEPQVWEPHQVARIGSFWLSLESEDTSTEVIQSFDGYAAPVALAPAGVQSPPVVAIAVGAQPPLPPMMPRPLTNGNGADMSNRPVGARPLTPAPAASQAGRNTNTPVSTQSGSRTDRIGISIDPETMTLSPGRSSVCRLTLANLGSHVEHFNLSVEGVPESWVEFKPPRVQLNPDRQENVTINVNIPRTPDSAAGDRLVIIRAHSTKNPNEFGEVQAHWLVQPFYSTTQVIKPRRVSAWRNANYAVVLQNDGNAPARYVLRGEDDDQVLEYELANDRMTLNGGQSTRIKLRVGLPMRWYGRSQQYNFAVLTRSETSGEAQESSAQFIQNAVIPTWLLPMLLAFAVVYFMWLMAIPPMPARVQPFVKRTGWSLLNPSTTPRPTQTPVPSPTPSAIPVPEPTDEPPPPTPTPVTPTATLPPTNTPTVTPTLTPLGVISCTSALPNVLSGVGPPLAGYLVYFDRRVIGGGSIGRDGRFVFTLRIGEEAPGSYPVRVVLRSTGDRLGEWTCTVPEPTER